MKNSTIWLIVTGWYEDWKGARSDARLTSEDIASMTATSQAITAENAAVRKAEAEVFGGFVVRRSPYNNYDVSPLDALFKDGSK